MARRPRRDTPGSWHHVVNRALGKRPYFETRSDKRYFLARLATEVRAGRIEVHAFSLMTTHFHLLVRSPIGEVSEAMRRVQWAYSRHFNRRRGRDGPLIRARYRSKRVDSLRYRRAVVTYIDANAVRARLVRAPEDHEFGSARAFLGGAPPPWLSSDWIVSRALELTGAQRFDASTYRAAFGTRREADSDAFTDWIEARMDSPIDSDPLDDLVNATPGYIRAWMSRRAALADGMEVGLPLCAPIGVELALAAELAAHGEWLVDREHRTWRGSDLARAGLLRELCSLPLARVARLCGQSLWRVTRQAELHRDAIRTDAEHGRRAAQIAHGALQMTCLE